MNDQGTNRYSLVEMVQPLVARYVRTVFGLAGRFSQADVDALVPGVTQLGNIGWLDKAPAAGCDKWTYRSVSPHRTDGQHGFLFTAPLTTAQKNRAVLSFWDEDYQPWDAVLDDIEFISDPNFPIVVPYFDPDTGKYGQAKRPRIYVQDSFRDAETILSPVFHEIFISDTPFPPERHPSPQPTPINSAFQALEVNYGRCLHDDTTIPAQSLVYDALLNGEPSGIKVGSGALSEQTFPATNFTKRMPHVRKNEVQQLGVLWAKHRETVFPKDDSDLPTVTH